LYKQREIMATEQDRGKARKVIEEDKNYGRGFRPSRIRD
jgi:hypothetical protein